MKRVLFVCLGNICRSPLAEAIFIHKINELGKREFFQVDSCGTSNYNIGSQPDYRTIANAKKHGIKMNHAARQFSSTDFEGFDIILAMDKSNYNNILSLSPSKVDADKIRLMREFDPQGKGRDVPDPYYGHEKDFQEVFEILDRCVDRLISHLFGKIKL